MDFYTQISEYYKDIFPLNKAQVTFVKSYLDKGKATKSMLDIGCSTGDLSVELCDYFDVIAAIDTNEEMLEIARANNNKIDFKNISMLDVDTQFPSNTFDFVLCFGNTIVHLQNNNEIELLFQKVKTILKPNGKFLFQIINYDNVLDNNLKELPTIENNRIKFERYYNIDQNNMIDFSTTLTIKTTGEEIISSIKLFPARKQQIEQSLLKAGFENIISFSSFNKNEYSKNSLPLVFECY